jgi:hypothetical protein
MSCLTDTDCEGRQVCYRQSFTPSFIGQSTCKCPANLEGSLCEPTGSTNVRTFIEAILMVIVLCMLSVTVRDMVRAKSQRLFSCKNPTTQTQIFLSMAYSAQAIVHFCNIGCNVENKRYLLVAGFKSCTLTPLLLAAQLTALICGFWAFCHVGLLWYQVAQKSKRLLKNTNFGYGKFMYVIEISFFLAMLGSFVAIRIDIATIVLVIFGFILVFVYIVGGCRLRNVLREATSSQAPTNSHNTNNAAIVGGSSSENGLASSNPKYMGSTSATTTTNHNNNTHTNATTTSSVDPLRVALRRVEYTAAGVVLSYSLCLICLIISIQVLKNYGSAAYQPGGWNMPYSTLLTLTYISLTTAGCIVCTYTHLNFDMVYRRTAGMTSHADLNRKLSPRSSSSSRSSGNGNGKKDGISTSVAYTQMN